MQGVIHRAFLRMIGFSTALVLLGAVGCGALGQTENQSFNHQTPTEGDSEPAGTVTTPPATSEAGALEREWARTPPDMPQHHAYAALRDVWLTADGGESWSALGVEGQINRSTYLSAAAVSPHDQNHIVVGTTFVGLFESFDAGKTWSNMATRHSAVRFFFMGSGFYEEVSAIAFDPVDPNLLYVAVGFGFGNYRLDRSQNTAVPVPEHQIDALPRWLLSPAAYAPIALREQRAEQQRLARERALESVDRRQIAADRTGVYLNPFQTTADRLEAHLQFLHDHGMNSIVVDFKDDFGILRYNSQLEIVRQVGAVNQAFDARSLIETAHAAGIYVVARLVVFKDQALFGYQNNRFALWDRVTNRPWGVFRREQIARSEQDAAADTDDRPAEYRWVQVEHWVDPYSTFVQDYNIAIARELEDLGVDEIQFDYIRFPSDGDTQNIVARFLPELISDRTVENITFDRVTALETFLARARQQIAIPISIDVFGFNAWSRMSYLGQDVEVLAHHVDVISPMWYPSHFSQDFLPRMTYLDRARFIYEHGSERMAEITPDVIIRPYVQAFLIGSELNFERPTYVDYLNRQILGLIEGSASGFSLWNASGRYYMVDRESFPSVAR